MSAARTTGHGSRACSGCRAGWRIRANPSRAISLYRTACSIAGAASTAQGCAQRRSVCGGRIQRVAFAAPGQRLRILLHLRWVDDTAEQAGLVQRDRQRAPSAAGGFQHDQGGGWD
ncbi:MAG: hypothetical protein LC769_09180, partial [Chloroflexi bacterium]|nr:hypothetical protein [Chloroflexota bacterium]